MSGRDRYARYHDTGLVPYAVARRASVLAWMAGATFSATVALFAWWLSR